MKEQEFKKIESIMKSYIKDSAHDLQHIYRVLYIALEIAKYEKEESVDLDVLTAACLLHDIARDKQFTNPNVCHAIEGGNMAFEHLISIGWEIHRAEQVKDCIQRHRFRNSFEPITIEAKILFDADKIDATGLIGISRTLIYKGQVLEPLYTLNSLGCICDGNNEDDAQSFFQEYCFKLRNITKKFYTKKAKSIAEHWTNEAERFYEALLKQVNFVNGFKDNLENLFTKE